MARPGREVYRGIKKGQHLAVVLALMLVATACSVVAPSIPTSTPAPTPGSPLGLIAYVGNDGNIYTIDRDGKQKNAITQDADFSPTTGQVSSIYQYPTWAPDGQHLAFMNFNASDPSGTQANLFTALSDGKERVKAFTSQDTLPFYLFWSPDSQSVTFLGSDAGGGGLALYLAPAAGGESKVVNTGNPYYWDWSPDNHTLIVHTGGTAADNPDARLALIEMGSAPQIKELDLKPGDFQAPAWSPSGEELVLSAQNEAGEGELVLAGRDGKVKSTLAAVNGPAAFAWSPTGGQLAYTTQIQAEAGPSVRLFVLDTAQPDRSKEIAQGEVVAFFWSPDGQKIVYFSPATQVPGSTALIAQTTPQFMLAVKVYDLASGESKQVAAIIPTESFLQIFPFYDQYQRSGTLWSPDSRSLVLAAVDSAGDNAIYVVGADGSQYHKVAAGDLAFWSWK